MPGVKTRHLRHRHRHRPRPAAEKNWKGEGRRNGHRYGRQPHFDLLDPQQLADIRSSLQQQTVAVKSAQRTFTQLGTDDRLLVISQKRRITSQTSNVSNDDKSIVVYQHSPVIYWWPVWVLGFVLSALFLSRS